MNKRSFGTEKENSSSILQPKRQIFSLKNANKKSFGRENKLYSKEENVKVSESITKTFGPVNKIPFRSMENDKKSVSRSTQENLTSLSNKPVQPSTELRRPIKKGTTSKFTVYRDPLKSIARQSPMVSRGLTIKVLEPTIYIPDDTDFFDLFGEDKPSISNLPVDCLIAIFQLLKDTTSLRIISSVCQHWRRIAQQPFLWRDIYCTDMDINRGMMKLNENPLFEHIRKLTIDSKCITNKLRRRIECIAASPFKQLEILRFDHTSLNDIEFIMAWIRDVKTVQCDNIPVNESRTVHMPNFSFMKNLKHFKLQFSERCSLKITYFFKQPDLKNLPSSLESLELSNLFDEEENRISRQDMMDASDYMMTGHEGRTRVRWGRPVLPVQIWDNWMKLEDMLVLKYKMLASLRNLKSLSVDRISSFTARIWNECLLPCSSQLRLVSFKGWYGDRESLQSRVERMKNERSVMDIEQAISTFISSLSSIEVIILDDFICSIGLIQGLQKLDKKYTVEDGQSLEVGKMLINCKIIIKKS